MNLTEQILLVILASFLALFLLLGIILLAKLIGLANKMQAVAEKAHDIADKVDDVSNMFKKTAGPMAVGKFFVNIAETVAKHKKEK